jgi:uncharacterized protein
MNMKRTRVATGKLAVLLILTTGCLSPRPDPSVFLVLTPAAPQLTSAFSDDEFPHMVVGVGPVVLPAYLERPQLVSRREATELAVDPFARWSAPLDVLFAEALADHIGALLGPRQVVVHPWASRDRPTHTVRIVVQQFERVALDQALLRAHWEVVDPSGKRVGTRHTSEHRTTAGGTPQDAALALSELVGMLAVEVAAALR